MYKTSDINPKDLEKIQVRNQDKIVEITGEQLVPSRAWEIIKNESKDFTADNPKAKQADELFFELLKVNGLIKSKEKKENTSVDKKSMDDQERIRIRERERARAIQIMKLQLQIAA